MAIAAQLAGDGALERRRLRPIRQHHAEPRRLQPQQRGEQPQHRPRHRHGRQDTHQNWRGLNVGKCVEPECDHQRHETQQGKSSQRLAHARTGAKEQAIATREVTVTPLTVEETTQLTIALVGQDTEAVRRRALDFAQQTGGNPFLLTELIGCYDPAADSFRAMPIHEMIDNKLARLPPEAALLLEAIAKRP